MSPTQATLAERAFEALNRFPAWLESFDALAIPGWSVLLIMAAATIGLIFAVREFLSWFLKTNALIDEVLRLENLVRDLQGDLSALEGTVSRLQTTAGIDPQARLASNEAPTDSVVETVTEPARPEPTFRKSEKEKAKPQFRLEH